jgi:hypothetical protein
MAESEVWGKPGPDRRLSADALSPKRRDDLLKGGSVMVISASTGVRVAAGIVCAVFVPFVLIHLLWAVGITWGLEEMFPEGQTEASIALTVVSLAAAAVASGAIFVTLARAGWLKTRLSDRVLHIGNWLVFAWPAIGTLNPLSTWGMRAVTLPLAIAAFVVARAHTLPHAGEAPRSPVPRAPVAH